MRKGFPSKGQPTTNAVSKVLESAAAIQTFVAPVSGRPNNLPTGMFFSYFLTNLPPDIPPTGWLKFYLPVWKRITQDPWVLQVVQGYQLELLSNPVQQSVHFPTMSLAHRTVLDQEVQSLLD